VVRRSAAGEQILGVLQTHGIVASFGPLPEKLKRLSRGGPRRRAGSLLVFFAPWPADATGAGQQRGRVAPTATGGGATAGIGGAAGRGHRLVLLRKPSRRHHNNKRSYAELRRAYASGSTIGLLETSRGVVSTREALRHRLGGWLLAELLL